MYSVKKRFSTTEDNRRYKIFRKEGYQMDERLTQEQRELVEKNLILNIPENALLIWESIITSKFWKMLLEFWWISIMAHVIL